ncbi:Frag1/DRAM/Sfk1 family-domain-containing protein [Boletus coccyginus]|nr:Frag1/DRAM/Sfk1 family-domain-containing protein [Boletus coccyginus]
MSLLSQRHRYFVVIPLFSAFIWFSSLLAMLLTWAISGCPKYVPTQVTVVYISDVGASSLKPLFVVACCITGSGLVISLTIERLLRHEGRLPPELRRREHVFGRLAIVGAVIAMLGLACLSGFDLGRYPTTHMVFLLVFLVGVSLSAIFTVIEFRWLAHDFAEIEKLKRAYVAKAVIGLTLVVFGIPTSTLSRLRASPITVQALQFLKFTYKQSRLNFTPDLIAEEVDYSISGLVTQRTVDKLTEAGAVDELCELFANETANE